MRKAENFDYKKLAEDLRKEWPRGLIVPFLDNLDVSSEEFLQKKSIQSAQEALDCYMDLMD